MDHVRGGRIQPLRNCLRSLFWLVLAAGATPTSADALSVVQSVTATSERVTIFLSAPVAFQHASLLGNRKYKRSDRCYVDVSPASLGNQTRSRIEVNSKLVRRVRAAQFRPATVRVVLDLVSAQDCQVRVLTAPDRLDIAVGPETDNEAHEAGTLSPPLAPPVPAPRLAAATAIPVKVLSPANEEQAKIAGRERVTLQLEEAVAIALAQHPALRGGQATVEAARYRVGQERAGYLPRGAYTYQYFRQQIPTITAVGGIEVEGGSRTRMTSQTFNFNSTNFSIRQLLFDFGRTLDAIRSAAASVEASRSELETTRQTVIFNTQQAYYGLLSAQRLQQVAEETVQQNKKHLEEAQARFEVGLAPRFDVTQAQVQVSTAELDQVTARNNVALARETLRTAMGVTGPFLYTLVDTLAYDTVTFDDEALLVRAYANRPELRSIQAQQRATALRVSALQKQFLPAVSGEAQYNWTGREHPLQEGWLWGVALTFPLFDDILTTAQVGEARADLQGLEAQEENLRQQIAFEVRQIFLNVREAVERIRLSEQTLVQATENLDLAEGRYSAGVGNIIEVTDAQVSLTSARANNVQALYIYKTALAELEKAVGRRLE